MKEEAGGGLSVVFFAVNGTETRVTFEHIPEAALDLTWKSNWLVPQAFPQPSSGCEDAMPLNLTFLL